MWQPLIEWMQAELAVVNSIKQKKAEEKEEEARKKKEEIRLRRLEIKKQKQLELSEQKIKQDEFEEKRQQVWLQFIDGEVEYNEAKSSEIYYEEIWARSGTGMIFNLVATLVTFGLFLVFLVCRAASRIDQTDNLHKRKLKQLASKLEKDKIRITQEYGENPFDDDNKIILSYDYCYCCSGQSFTECHGKLD